MRFVCPYCGAVTKHFTTNFKHLGSGSVNLASGSIELYQSPFRKKDVIRIIRVFHRLQDVVSHLINEQWTVTV